MKRLQHTGAFVVQFRPETDPDAGLISGRVEHVASCEAARFASCEELLAFVARVLSVVRAEREIEEAPAVQHTTLSIPHTDTQE